jgi:hypothetical protein
MVMPTSMASPRARPRGLNWIATLRPHVILCAAGPTDLERHRPPGCPLNVPAVIPDVPRFTGVLGEIGGLNLGTSSPHRSGSVAACSARPPPGS